MLPEIVDLAIGHLWGDKRSLSSCALVSRSWVPASQFNLFRDIHYGSKSGFNGLQQFLYEHPHLCSYVQDLTLVGKDRGDPFGLSVPPPFCSHVLSDILSLLPRLSALSLADVPVGSCECMDTDAVHEPRALELLGMHSVGIPTDNLQDLLEIFSLFSTVKEFTVYALMEGADWMDHEHLARITAQAHIPSHIQVHSLCLEGSSPSVALVCNILRQTLTMQSLRSVDAVCEDWDEALAMGALLRDSRPNVNSVEFRVLSDLFESEPKPTFDDWQQLYLSSCTGLQSLTLHLAFGGSDSWGRWDRSLNVERCKDISDAVVNIISFLPSSIRDIILVIDFTEYAGEGPGLLEEFIDWARMDAISNRLQNLKTFTFHLTSDDDPKELPFNECRRVVETRLPILLGRELLSVKLKN